MKNSSAKVLYYLIFTTLLVALDGSYAVLAIRAHWGWAVSQVTTTPILFICSLVASWGATCACRALGRSEESEIIETISRKSYVQADGQLLNDIHQSPIEFSNASLPGMKAGLFSGILICVLCGIGTVLFLINPADDANMVGKWAAPIGLMFFGALTLGMWLGMRNVYTLADANGVHDYLKHTVVRWQEIEDCEIKTRRNVIGDVNQVLVTLKDKQGHTLMALNLAGVPQHPREQVLQALASHCTA